MNQCSGHIRYLIAIKELMETNDTIKCVHISRHLGVSRPSVSKMLRCLAASELVYEDFCNGVKLTPEGKKAVSEISDVFGEVYLFFRKFLKLSHEEAHKSAVTFLTEYPLETCKRLKGIVSRTINKRSSANASNT